MVSAENDPRPPGAIWAMNLDWPTPTVTPLVPVAFTCVGPEAADRLATAMGLADPAAVRRRFDTARLYPNMDHTINQDEVEFVRGLMLSLTSGALR